MELATLSSSYGNFYAPAFAVRLGRDDLMRDLLVAVSQVEVDLVLGAASRFTLHRRQLLQPRSRTLQDRPRRRTCSSLLTFGAEVEICMGYGDAKSTPLHGERHGHRDHDELPGGRHAGARRLRLRPRLPADASARTRAPGPRRCDSDAAHEIASFHNLNADDRDDQGEAPADRAEPGERLGVPEEARRPQSLRAVRRRAAARCTSRKPNDTADRGGAARLGRRAAELQARGESRRPDLAGRGLRLGSEDEGGDRRHARPPARSRRTRRQERGRSTSTRFVQAIPTSSRRCACASRCSRRPRPTSAPRPRSTSAPRSS